MEQLGSDFSATGSVMSKSQLEDLREKRGECKSCGQKCFNKKLFKKIPISIHGRVLNGRCLNCNPLNVNDSGAIPAVSRPATREDLARFSLSQSNLGRSGHVGRGTTRSRPSSSDMNNARSPARVGSETESMGGEGSARAQSSFHVSSGNSTSSARSFESLPSTHHSNGFPPNVIGQERRNSGRIRPRPRTPDNEAPQVHQRRQMYNASELTADRSVSGRSLASAMSSGDGIMTPSESFYDDYGSEDMDNSVDHYVPPSFESRPGGGELQAALERITGQCIDEEEAFALASVGASAHPAAVQLLDYYRRTFRESRRNLAAEPQQGGDSLFGGQFLAEPEHGILNRGGAVSFNDLAPTRPSSNRQVDNRRQSGGSHSSGAGRQSSGSHSIGTGHRQNSRQNQNQPMLRAESTRSIETMESMEDGYVLNSSLRSHNHSDTSSSSPLPFDRPATASSNRQLDAHLSMYASAQSLNVSQHPSDHSQSLRSLMSRSQMYVSDHGVSPSQHSLPQQSEHSSGPQFLVQQQYSSQGLQAASPTLQMQAPALHMDAGPDQLRAAGTDFVEILNVMIDFPQSAEVQSNAMQVLSDLDLQPQECETLAQIGGIQVIIEAMRTFPLDLELQICGCRAIWNVSGTAENQLAFVEAGGLDVIMDGMDGYLDIPDMQEQALAALGNLGAVEANLERMMEKGIVGRIVEAMNKHAENVDVQMKGCSAITNLASHVTPLKKSIMDFGGGGAVVISMVMHPADAELQETALRTLRNLTAQCEENKMEIANIGGVDAVITALQVHRDVAGVQEAGAWTLTNLAGHPDVKILIGNCGGIDVIVRAMWVHSDYASVTEWCCRALYTLSLDRRNSKMVLEVGGILAVVNAMQAHSDSFVVQEMGCAILCNLAGDQSSKIRIVDEEALDAVVLAMVLYGDSVVVQERACQALLQLAIRENLKAMHASNIGELVRTANNSFPANCGETAQRLLYVLESFASEYNGG